MQPPHNFTPETDQEVKIVNCPIFAEASEFGSPRRGHPEGKVGNHIEQILAYIDTKDWETYRTNLRTLAFTHDLGKYRVVRTNGGHIQGKPHSQHSLDIALEYDLSNDPKILDIIPIHDKYYGFFKKDTLGKFKPQRFIETFQGIDLELLTRFNYADSCQRDKDSVVWFEYICHALGLKNHLLFKEEPELVDRGS
jgi:hypothetical protein